MKLILEKDIIISKGTIFEKRDDFSNHFWTDKYDIRIALNPKKDKSIKENIHNSSIRIMTSDEDKEYFKKIK